MLKRWILLIILLHVAAGVQAVNLTAAYTSACRRTLGVIVSAKEDSITLLTLQGEFKTLSRYDIVFLAYYPVGEVPIEAVEAAAKVQPIQVQTTFGDELKELVYGWPIDFSDEEIDFLSVTGEETVIRRDSIWEITTKPLVAKVRFSYHIPNYKFVHPYAFAHCKLTEQGPKVYPGLLLSDPLRIKLELDRLQESFQDIEGYEEDRRFYPVPQLFGNKSILGVWANLGSRYGDSVNRSNNFAPSFVSELSEGPFGFQRILVTGTHFLWGSLHEEPQSQFYYFLKADYVHFSFMYDFNRVLIGEENYKWQFGDLGILDDRVNELQHILGGFDYGHWAVEFSWTPIQYAFRQGDRFFRNRVGFNKSGLSFESRFFKGELIYGFSVDGKIDNIFFSESDTPEETAEKTRLKSEIAAQADYTAEHKMWRLNLKSARDREFRPMISFIHKTAALNREENAGDYEETFFDYFATYATMSLSFSYKFDEELMLLGYGSLEVRSLDYRDSEGADLKNETQNFLKGGLNLSLAF